MFESGHLSGGAPILRRFPIGATIANAGIVAISATDAVGIRPATTTSFADSVGLILETGTYSTTQADLDDPGSDPNIGADGTVTSLDMGRVVLVSIRPDLILRSLCSGAAAEGTALTTLANTALSAAGTTITDADVGTASFAGGYVWCTKGNNVGHARVVTTFTISTSVVVTVPFPRAIAVNDEFLWIPYNFYGDGTFAPGAGNLQTTTLFTQANAAIAAGTGGAAVPVYADLKGARDTFIYFMLGDHVLHVYTT